MCDLSIDVDIYQLKKEKSINRFKIKQIGVGFEPPKKKL